MKARIIVRQTREFICTLEGEALDILIDEARQEAKAHGEVVDEQVRVLDAFDDNSNLSHVAR